MLLYAIYRNGGAGNKDVTEERGQALEPMRNIVVGIPLRASEVFPIPVNDDVNEQGKVGAKDAEEKENSVEIIECPV